MSDPLIGTDPGGIVTFPRCYCGHLETDHHLRANQQSNARPCTLCECSNYRPDPEAVRLAEEAGVHPNDPEITRERPL